MPSDLELNMAAQRVLKALEMAKFLYQNYPHLTGHEFKPYALAEMILLQLPPVEIRHGAR